MSLWLRILLAIVIWVVATLSTVAILQINGISTRVWPNFVGLIAAGLFLLIAREKDQTSTTEVKYSEKDGAGDAGELSTQPRTVGGRSSEVKENPLLDTSMEIEKNNSGDKPQVRDKKEMTQSNDKLVWQEEFQILNEYDPVVKECHDELEALNPQLSSQFREEVVSDRKKATDIRDRLKAAHEKKLKPYISEELNEALAKARSLGPYAEEEFIRVVELMGEDIDVDDAIQRLSEKFIPDITFVTEYKSFRIYTDSMGKYVVYSPTNVKVSGSLDYDSIDTAKAFIDR